MPTVLTTIPTVFSKIKLGLSILALLASATAFYATGKALITVPEKLDRHDSLTMAGFKSIDKMLCIQVADHRKKDWHLCYINPSEILPVDRTR